MSCNYRPNCEAIEWIEKLTGETPCPTEMCRLCPFRKEMNEIATREEDDLK